MEWYEVILGGVVILLVGPLILEVSSKVTCSFLENGDEVESLGIIKDFDVSAGGFGSSTKCTIETESTKVVGTGSNFCSTLQINKELIVMRRSCSNDISWFKVKEIQDTG